MEKLETGSNLVISFPPNTDEEELMARCRSYIRTKAESEDAIRG